MTDGTTASMLARRPRDALVDVEPGGRCHRPGAGRNAANQLYGRRSYHSIGKYASKSGG